MQKDDLKPKLTPQEKKFVGLFTLTLIIAFSPSKSLGQISPLIFIGGLIFFVQLKPFYHLLKYVLVLGLYAYIGLIYYALMPEFLSLNYALFALTASSFLILFYDLRPIASPLALRKMAVIALVVVFLEAIYGIVQGVVRAAVTGGFDIANGDVVRGTIEPGFTPEAGGGNVIFAILISTLLLFVFSVSEKTGPINRIVLYKFSRLQLNIPFISLIMTVTIFLAWVLASVLHTILFFIIAATAAIFFLTKVNLTKKASTMVKAKHRGRTIIGLTLIILSLVVFAVVILPRNIQTIPYFFNQNLRINEYSPSGKARATYYTLYLVPKKVGLQPLIGLGPGQYSSRASLIRSGEYLRGGIPFEAAATSLAEQYIITLWVNQFKNNPGSGGGSSFFPYYSWLSLYSETGVMGLLIVGFILWRGFWTFRKYRSLVSPRLNLGLMTMLFYVVLLGIQDNYWEFTQAIFPAILILRLGYTYLRQEKKLKQTEKIKSTARINHNAYSNAS